MAKASMGTELNLSPDIYHSFISKCWIIITQVVSDTAIIKEVQILKEESDQIASACQVGSTGGMPECTGQKRLQ